MPPKAKITREEILESAYQLALQEGYGSLSSRNVARAAGCSVQPVFSHFPTMEELRQETYRYACKKCADEVLSIHDGRDLLTVLTDWMLDLAKNRSNLFALLYLSDLNMSQTLPAALMKAENHQRMTDIVSQVHGLSNKDSEDILVRSCIFLMGIGTMICINQVDISETQVRCMMKQTVDDFVAGIKRKENNA